MPKPKLGAWRWWARASIPGFVMDKLLITLSAASQDIESARAMRIVDASKRRLPLQKKVGAGMSVEEFREQVAAGVIKHHGLPESVAMVSDALGLGVDEITETIEPVIARERVQTEFLEVAAGQVAGVHQIARGYRRRQGKNLHGIADVRRRARSRAIRSNCAAIRILRSRFPAARTAISPPRRWS